MDAIDFFMLQHGRLHLQLEGDFLHGLSDAQMRGHPDGLNFIVKAFSVLYARQRVGHDQPAVDGDGEPIMVVNGRRRAGG